VRVCVFVRKVRSSFNVYTYIYIGTLQKYTDRRFYYDNNNNNGFIRFSLSHSPLHWRRSVLGESLYIYLFFFPQFLTLKWRGVCARVFAACQRDFPKGFTFKHRGTRINIFLFFFLTNNTNTHTQGSTVKTVSAQNTVAISEYTFSAVGAVAAVVADAIKFPPNRFVAILPSSEHWSLSPGRVLIKILRSRSIDADCRV